MLWTDLMGKVNMVSRWMLCCALLSVNLVSQLVASNEASLGTLVCDDQINVSLSISCEAVITVGMVLEGESQIPNYDPDNYEISIEGVAGNTLTEVGIYTVTITERNPPFTPPLNSCWGHILVEDKLPPVIDPGTCNCPEGNTNPDCMLPLLCNDLTEIYNADFMDVPMPTAIDNCTEVITDFYDEVFDNGDCSTTVVKRIWVFTDGGGNQIESCPFYYRISPITLSDDIEGPESEVLLDCGVGFSPQEIYEFFANQYREDNPCGGMNPGLCDPFSPYYDQDLAEQYEIDVHEYAVKFAYPNLAGIPLINNICNTATTYTDIELPICSINAQCTDNLKVIRTWRVYDWCNVLAEPLEYVQIIKAADQTPPHIEVAGFNASVDPWGCTAAIYFPEPLHLTDNCSSFVGYDVTSELPWIDIHFDPVSGKYFAHDVPLGQYQFYYNAFDCCENITSQGIIVNVRDNTPPVAITKQDIVVTLIPNHGYQGSQGLTKVFTQSIDNGSWDGCSENVKLEIRRSDQNCGYGGNTTYNNDGHSFDDPDDTDDGKFVTFCCQDLIDYGVDADGDGVFDYAQIKVWLRVWDDGDGDGIFGTIGDNYSEVWSYVRLEDKNRPTLQCPPDITIDCKADEFDLSIVGQAVATGPCGPVPVAYEDIDSDMTSCNIGTITRRWYVVGQPDVFCPPQYITKSSSYYGGPVIHFPKDTVATCLDDLDEIPTWTGGHCDLLAYSVTRDTFFFEAGACFKIINYWTVIDWCVYDPDDLLHTGGIWTDVQVVKIIDNDGPIFENCEDQSFFADDKPDLDNDNIQCENNNVILRNTASDNGDCASDWLKWTVHVDLFDDGVVEYTFSSTADPFSPYHIPTTSSGEEVEVKLPEGVLGSMSNHRVVWRVTDGCGNYSTCISYFMVVDNIPPTPYCVNLSTALMENGQVELWACDFDLGSFDNCTEQENLRFTFSDVLPQNDPSYNPQSQCSSKIFTCDDVIDAAGFVLTVDVYVWDEKNNYDYCSVFLTLVDNQNSCEDVGNMPTAQIGGTVVTGFGEEIENVQVELYSAQPEYPVDKLTDASGHYIFTKNNMYTEYELRASKEDSPLNGVSTLDLVLIQKHILGLEYLNDPYLMIAADVNNDGNISAIDLLELRKLILGVYNYFPNNEAWRFVDEGSIPSNSQPWGFDEVRTIPYLDNNMMQEDFIGVKVGDVNRSVIMNSQDEELPEMNSIDILFEDKHYEAGDVFTTTLSLEQEFDITGFQFVLKANDLMISDIRYSDLEFNQTNFAIHDNQKLAFSWNADRPADVQNLITVEFTALADGSLSNNLSIASEMTRSEVYLGEQNEIIPLTLTGRNNSEHTFELFQNTPNPFSNSTVISFNLPERSEVSLSIMDVTGRIIMSTNGVYDRGLNNIEISSNDLRSNGILYYRLDAGKHTATKKMIIIE